MALGWIRLHAWMLCALARLAGVRPTESLYPVDRTGRPDLRYYTASLAHYVAMHEAFLAGIAAGKRTGGKRLFALRVHATWGLIAQGEAARAYARSLLAHASADAREDGAGILAALDNGGA